MNKDQELTGLIVVIVLIVLLYLGNHFLGSIKTAPISLVPQGQATAQVAAASAQTALASQSVNYQQQLATNAAIAQNNAALGIQTQNAYGALGSGLGALAASIANKINNADYNYTNGY